MGISVELKGAWAVGKKEEDLKHVVEPLFNRAYKTRKQEVILIVECNGADDGGYVEVQDSSLTIKAPVTRGVTHGISRYSEGDIIHPYAHVKITSQSEVSIELQEGVVAKLKHVPGLRKE